MQNFKFVENDQGYTVVQVFKDAEAFEIHLNNTLKAPFYDEILYMNEFCVERIAMYLIGLPAEIEKAPSILRLYPDVLIIKSLPKLGVYGEPIFGWL